MDTTFSNSGNGYEDLLPPPEVLRRLAVSESGFVFDPASGNSFTVNETGLAIVRALQHDRDMPIVIASLLREYEIKPRDLERDLVEFAGALRDCIGAT